MQTCQFFKTKSNHQLFSTTQRLAISIVASYHTIWYSIVSSVRVIDQASVLSNAVISRFGTRLNLDYSNQFVLKSYVSIIPKTTKAVGTATKLLKNMFLLQVPSNTLAKTSCYSTCLMFQEVITR